ncbi:minor tail protein [Paenibacillus phage Wanderer]|uniref:Tail protein n=3 Tax=Gochnauervirinae TaxID=2842525 RepID=A0A345ARH9_9CAUD|nr:minor tail protein [Paenibacillus phage Dragolir]YP_010080237.1 minor tail protein [Paenibacillus phage Wanderer]AUS03421.1 tail protein [Paenibacillus phage Dragolir]AXF39433.1 tail protein [Paenibacillus phage Wanderer]AXF40317.1 tail protein [Paenibacillus phage LincolnB]
MEPIRLIDTDFNLLGEVDSYSSLKWVRRWHKPGEVELRINPFMQNANELQEDVILFKASRPEEAVIIKHREISIGEDGAEELIVKGSMLASLIGRRITYPPEGRAYDYMNAPIETIVKQIVKHNCINSVDRERRIPGFICAPDQGRGEKIQFQTRYKPLAEEVEKLSLMSQMGWGVSLDIENRWYVFDMLTGRNLTADQDIRPPAIFSTDYDNIESQSYVNSAIGHKNVAIIGGQGEGEDRKIVTVGTSTGLNRYEMFVDARDVGTKEEGKTQTESEVEQMLTDRGHEKLSEVKRVESLEAKILTQSNLTYRKDYDLGDVVTVLNRQWGLTMNTRITEVAEVYEPSQVRIDITFGNSIPTLADVIGRKLRS